MSDIFHLIKLYNRKRYNKLLREGIAFLVANEKNAPEGVFLRQRDGTGLLHLANTNYFSLHLLTNGMIKKTDLKTKEVEIAPYQVCKFELLDSWTIHMAAEMIGEILYLFIPKEQITVSMIVHCHISTIQMRLINTYGEKAFFSKLNASVVHKDGDSELLRVRLGAGRVDIMMVKVKDTTTGQIYLLRVPSEIEVPNTHDVRFMNKPPVRIPMRTCQQAIAWTFGMKEHEYNPVKES